ncbi:MAG: alpha/beta hydrolase [Caulobacter sp.]|nr:alpha/beta hydrolase [Caulobacter sp.]
MVHGAFCGGWIWEDFRKPFEAAGHPVLTPDLPGHAPGGDPAGQSMSDYAAHIVALCASWGVYGSTMEEGASAVSLYALGPFWLQSVAPDRGLAGSYSLDRLDRAGREAAFARMVPESGRALWETLNWWLDPFMTTQVSSKPGLPVLALVGGKDVIHPPVTVRQTAQRLAGEAVVFEDMSHWLPGEPGWERVAARCLAWLRPRAGAPRSCRPHRRTSRAAGRRAPAGPRRGAGRRTGRPGKRSWPDRSRHGPAHRRSAASTSRRGARP